MKNTDEIKRCLEVLGLKPGANEDEAKQAYRELAMVWHPDRFPSNSPLQAKADVKLKELNAAYEYLLTHGFRDGVPLFPEPPIAETETAAPPTEAEPSTRNGRGVWIFRVVLLVLSAAGAVWWFESRPNTPSPATVQNQVRIEPIPATNPVVIPAPAASAPGITISPNNLLPTMRGSGDMSVTTNREGTSITGETWLLTRDEYSPPFVIRAVAKTDVTNIRLIYGQGSLIFN